MASFARQALRASSGVATVVVTGAGGQLGVDLVRELSERGHEVVGLSHAQCDVSDRAQVVSAISAAQASTIVHAAAWTDVDGCELDAARAFRMNALGTRNVAEAARATGAHVVYVSTDYVFDGTSERPYHEWDSPHPRSVYGAAKLAGERELDADATVVRTSWVCGAHGRNFVRSILAALANRDTLDVVADQRGAATFTFDLAAAIAWLVQQRAPGVFHVRNDGELTWCEFAQEIARLSGSDPERIRPITTEQLRPARPAPRPLNSVLDGVAWRAVGGPALPEWRQSLQTLLAQVAEGQVSASAAPPPESPSAS